MVVIRLLCTKLATRFPVATLNTITCEFTLLLLLFDDPAPDPDPDPDPAPDPAPNPAPAPSKDPDEAPDIER